MTSFEAAHAFVKKWEGGYSFDRADRGGETIFGISRRAHPDWPGWAKLAAGDYSMTELAEMADGLYRREYWAPLKCDDYPQQRLATIVYQCAVNCGITRAVRWMQRSIAAESRFPITVDGKMGKKTLAALQKSSPDIVGDDVLDAQEEHYRYLGIADQSQRKFLQGWLNRVAAARTLTA